MRSSPVHLVAVVLAAGILAGGFWQPHDPDAVDMLARHQAPSPAHWLGTDHLGRDLASRMLVAGWRTTLVVLAVGLIGFCGGALIGTAAAIFGLSPLTAGLALGLAGVGPYALMANALTHRTLGLAYVKAARGFGAGGARLVRRHVLPATLPLLFVHVGSQAGQSVVAYAALAFIGLGADPSKPDWGSMLYEYRMFVFDDPWLMVWPGLGIAAVTTLLNLIFDPPGER